MMYLRLSRPCVRWLRNALLLAAIIFIITQGMFLLTNGKGKFASVKPGTERSTRGLLNYRPKHMAKLGHQEEDFTEDYDTETEPRLEVLAEIDETFNKLKQSGDDTGGGIPDYAADEMNVNYPGNEGTGDNNEAIDTDLDIKMRGFTEKKGDENVKKDEHKSDKTVKIVISSYGVQKPVVMDELFIDKDGVILFYQPSLTLQPMWYLRGDNKVCSMKSPTCKLAREDTSVTVLKCVLGFLQCSMWALESCVSPAGFVSHKDIGLYEACQKKTNGSAMCLELLKNLCTTARIRVLSVRNLAADVLRQLPKYLSNTQIIHVFQDPRAVLFSKRMEQPTYLSTHADAYLNRAKTLCARMKSDLKILSDIRTGGPALHFQTCLQRDLLNTTGESAVKFSKMFHMKTRQDLTVYDVIKSSVHTVVSRYRSLDKIWKLKLDKEIHSLTNALCVDVLNQLGIPE